MRTLRSEMIRYTEYLKEAKAKPVVFTFGRFNPITSGHEIAINDIIKQAKSKGGTPMIFTSQAQDKKKNPLSYNDKTKYLKAFWGKMIVKDKKIITAFDALKWLSDNGYKNVTMVVGSDRVAAFEKNIRPYIKHKDKKKSYEFDHFEVIQAGVARGKSNAMSASLMRKAAEDGDFDFYKKGVPSMASVKDAREMYDAVRSAMGLKEEYLEFGRPETTKRYKEWTPGEVDELKIGRHHKGPWRQAKWRDIILPKKLVHAFKRYVHQNKYAEAMKIYKKLVKEYDDNPKAYTLPGLLVLNPKGRALEITSELVGVSIGELKKVFDRETRYNSVNHEKNTPFTDYLEEEITNKQHITEAEIPHVYLDMDGVLVNFEKGVIKVHGKQLEDVPNPARWEKISDTPNFWRDLEWMPGAKALWKFLKPYAPSIMSAYAIPEPNSSKGKEDWLKKNVGSLPRGRINLVKRSDKQKFARDGRTQTPNILVDDYPKNIREWEANGGIGIHHTSVKKTIARLQELGFA